MSTTLRALPATLLLAGSLAAQTVLVVDAAGGPGSQFTDIQPDDAPGVLDHNGAYQCAGLSGPSPLSAVTGQGSLVRDPMVVLQPANGAPPVAVGSDRVLSVPSLQLLPSPGGTTLQIQLTGHPHSVYGLVVGSATTPWTLPGLGGTLFVGPPRFADRGVIGGQPVRMTCQTPAPPPLATMLVWQAVGIDASGGMRVSNPGFHVQTR